MLNSCLAVQLGSPFPLSPRAFQFYSRMSQASGNTFLAITSGAFLPRACSLGHTLPCIARNVSGGKHEYCWRHGVRGVRPAVCVRDGRFPNPSLIARLSRNLAPPYPREGEACAIYRALAFSRQHMAQQVAIGTCQLRQESEDFLYGVGLRRKPACMAALLAVSFLTRTRAARSGRSRSRRARM